ncbi:aldehyde reductase [Solwaraspora sp. WMMD791]|uniref:SDR family oxidoreductase n=1 Tax=Solwaraspora sp. WMMD791 TaxID=3016086 RepID=UPI00249B9E11|nr:aldehyde reductase [Solwaraspora sp. WMMD791]WFE30384.1 aldehyde reductase [Solwaraspora sp. WMMD791]
MSGELVLVTGGSGFIGAHCVRHLLQAGYRVRTTVRAAGRQADVRAMIAAGGVEPGEALSFATADLLTDDGWPAAVAGCDYVLHVASPVPLAEPQQEEDVVAPARDGVRRVLSAARAAGVRRTVLTSSFAAVKFGDRAGGRVFTEADWSDPAGGETMSAYAKSKLYAERAAWDLVADAGAGSAGSGAGGGMELAVVNPVGVFGPVLGPQPSLWADLVGKLLDGRQRLLPRMWVNVVDVRDVADLHLRAMTDPAAAGERFLASAGGMSLPQLAALLRDRFGDAAGKVPTRTLPDWAVRVAARFSPRAAFVVPELGEPRQASADKARQLLGWQPRPAEDAVIAMATSLIGRR